MLQIKNKNYNNGKSYTRKGVSFIKTSINKPHTEYYIPVSGKLVFHLAHIKIVKKKECG